MAVSEDTLRTEFGILRYDRIAGTPRGARFDFHQVEDDPAPPVAGAIIYCVADNGSAKREVRALFPTGSPIVVATEP